MEDQLTSKLILDNNYCWFHCASAGEFEQAIPIINNLRCTMYDVRIAVSFFRHLVLICTKIQISLICFFIFR
ncbi:MAG: hypothetical protein IPF58_08055 [Saprospirales bacterium]|nr:hypothetical protein [Saprospirales bacterium]